MRGERAATWTAAITVASCCLLGARELAAAAGDAAFKPVAPLNSARFFHTSTLLGNGKVLIAGGSTPTGPSKTAELYDPASATFSLLSSAMASGRYEHTATMLTTGKVLITGGVTANGATNKAEVFDPVSATFMSLSNTMSSARAGHTATLLGNGKVLLAGGFNGTGYTDTAEVFDPASGTFTSLSKKMISPRNNHTATVLSSGKVLMTGGFNGADYLNTAELFDPATGNFTAVPAMVSVRYAHTATLIPGGKVLVAGGYAGAASATTNTAELFDPATATFTVVAPMTSPRQVHTATLLASGKVLLAGGSTGVTATNTAELFDPATGTFASLAPNTMTAPRNAHTATSLPGGQVLLAAGNTVGLPQNTNSAELFDPVSGNFSSVSNTMTVARYVHSATQLEDAKVLIAGGAGSGAAVNSAELFDPAGATFAMLPPMNSARLQHTATLLMTGQVLIAGGFTGAVAANTAELFDPVARNFSLIANRMTAARLQHTATLLTSGKVLIAGGYDASGSFGGYSKTAEIFDPPTATFTAAAGTMTSTRQNHTATLLTSGKVLLAGGGTASGIADTAELFDPATRTFTSLSPNHMTTPRYLHTATLLPGGKVLLAGGHNGSAANKTAETFDPVTGTFTAAKNTMSAARYFHSATLLPSGKVLIAGGNTGAGGTMNNTADLFDPATQTFASISPNTMSVGRYNHTATLLPSGEVLLTGGNGFNGVTNTAELFDEDRGFSESRRPVILSAPAAVQPSAAIRLTGRGFRGDSEGAGSAFSSSATNYPVLQLRRIDNDQTLFVMSAGDWSDGSFLSQVIGASGDLPLGGYRITVFTNAIPSVQKLIELTDKPEPTPSPTATPTASPTPTSTSTPTPTATASAMPTSTASPTPTVTPSTSPKTTPTATPSATATPKPTVTATPTTTPGPTPTPSASPTSGNSRLENISTRVEVRTGERVGIAGFIIKGNSPKKVIVRGLGPSLKADGAPITGRLADPFLELHDSTGALIATNDNWRSSQEAEISATRLAPSDENEAAIVRLLTPGNYTAVIGGVAGSTGIALVEVYDIEKASDSELGNLSTRGHVEPNDNALIGGIILRGDSPQKVLLRAIGPELKAKGVAGVLEDPTMELHDEHGNLLMSNDNWRDGQQAEIEASGIPPRDDRESAIVRALTPGNYTAVVRGKNDTTGVALVEAYKLH